VKSVVETAQVVETEKTESSTQDYAWLDPLPLMPYERPDAYPIDALPHLIGDAINEITAFVQCSPALTSLAALGAISTVAAGLVDVRRTDKLIGPTGLYFLAVADSGERKTTVDDFFTKAIRVWEKEQEENAKPGLQRYNAALAAWTAKRDGLINAIREGSKRRRGTSELEGELSDLEGQKPDRPRVPRLLVCDATSEALTWLLACSWPVAGLLSSEGGLVLGGHAMRSDGIMKNLATLNTLWDGQPLTVDRRTSQSFSIRSARLTLNLAVQPETIRQFIDSSRGLARGSGFLARFLFAWPESTQGHRLFREAPKHWPALSRYHQKLSNLLNHPIRFEEGGQVTPVVLDLDSKAKSNWISFHDDVERELAPTGDLTEARDMASKAGDNAARLAALFHVFEHGPTGSVGADHMQRAARIVTWHLYEARRFLNQLAVPKEVTDALALEEWLIQKCKTEDLDAVRIADIQQKGPNRTRRKATLDSALGELEQYYRVKRKKYGRKAFVEINPKLLARHERTE
jgi:putative DNA primase/helicase